MIRIGITLLVCAATACGQSAEAREPLTRDRLQAPMEQVLAGLGATLEIVEFSQFSAPEGTVEFPLAGLSPVTVPDAPTRWRGFIRYGATGQERFNIWAIVRITAPCTRVIATERLLPGDRILGSQIRQEPYTCFPLAKNASWTLADVQNRAVTRSVREGDPVLPAFTAVPDAVKRGDELVVVYRAGAVRLRIAGVAETSGRLGDIIAVRNPATKKAFDARIESPGVVVVTKIP